MLLLRICSGSPRHFCKRCDGSADEDDKPFEGAGNVPAGNPSIIYKAGGRGIVFTNGDESPRRHGMGVRINFDKGADRLLSQAQT